MQSPCQGWAKILCLAFRHVPLMDRFELPFSGPFFNLVRSVQNGDNLVVGWKTAMNNQVGTNRPESHVPLGEIGSGKSQSRRLSQHLECLEELTLRIVAAGTLSEGTKSQNILQVLECIGRNYIRNIAATLRILPGAPASQLRA
jgi:hypothetical protein